MQTNNYTFHTTCYDVNVTFNFKKRKEPASELEVRSPKKPKFENAGAGAGNVDPQIILNHIPKPQKPASPHFAAVQAPANAGAGAGAGAGANEDIITSVSQPQVTYHEISAKALVKQFEDPKKFAKDYKINHYKVWTGKRVIKLYKNVVRLDIKHNTKINKVLVVREKEFWTDLEKKLNNKFPISALKDRELRLRRELPWWNNHLIAGKRTAWIDDLVKEKFIKKSK